MASPCVGLELEGFVEERRRKVSSRRQSAPEAMYSREEGCFSGQLSVVPFVESWYEAWT